MRSSLLLARLPRRQCGVIRLGRMTATPDFLASIPRPSLCTALRTHVRAVAVEGKPFETRHSCDGAVFRLRTSADRTQTDFRLDGEP